MRRGAALSPNSELVPGGASSGRTLRDRRALPQWSAPRAVSIGQRREQVFEIVLGEAGRNAAAAEQGCGELLLFLL